MAVDLDGKIDLFYCKLIKNFEALSEHIKRLDGQVAQKVISIRRGKGLLPGRTDINPRCQVGAITF